MSVNKVILIGRLGQNPEVKYTPSGAAVANFSVATNEAWTDKNNQKQERTEWHRVVVWGKIAELCGQYLQKGRQVYLEGRLQTRQWQDKEGQTKYTTEILAQTVQFLGGQAGAGQGAGSFEGAAGQSRPSMGFGGANGQNSGMGFGQGMAQSSAQQGGAQNFGGYREFGATQSGGSAATATGGQLGSLDGGVMEATFTEDDIPF